MRLTTEELDLLAEETAIAWCREFNDVTPYIVHHLLLTAEEFTESVKDLDPLYFNSVFRNEGWHREWRGLRGLVWIWEGEKDAE